MTDEANLYPLLEACVDLIKKEWNEQHEDHFGLILKRVGVEPIHDSIRKHKKH